MQILNLPAFSELILYKPFPKRIGIIISVKFLENWYNFHNFGHFSRFIEGKNSIKMRFMESLRSHSEATLDEVTYLPPVR